MLVRRYGGVKLLWLDDVAPAFLFTRARDNLGDSPDARLKRKAGATLSWWSVHSSCTQVYKGAPSGICL